ncbi:MAG: prephenate dehydrogenase [Candidatus Planktophila sp.]|nr:prephenate dehydrogenase [Candidatus Planktophila sp.]
MLTRVRIVGSGLIGTSIGLALVQSGIQVEMVDSDSANQALAMDLIGGAQVSDPELVIFAVPSSRLPLVIQDEFELNPNSTFMDVGSVKNDVVLEVETISGLSTRFVPTHPMAGREIGGAGAARADLFQGRSWIVTPSADLKAESRQIVDELIDLLGATSIELTPRDHDRAVAKISHMPQIAASLLAKQLVGTPPEWMDLAGQGLRDTTRIAGSDESLWKEIIYSNREELRSLLINLQNDLHTMINSLDNPAQIAELIASGRTGKSLIPGKHGGKAREYSYLPIVIDDKPGQLGAIFNECAAMDVNVEDLGIEHSPGQLSALITLALSQADAEKLSNHLSSIGWNVHPIRK